ncbi:hypothetical protein KJE20_06258 [Pyrenophora tritici-repentis]|uniref:Uncharacterized protein n=1 Tax=Pyrenophora tritici-repentis TaxID=45151 RepID=A0A922N8W0_9PLEO|nr:hypothetical protein Ptr86124_009210 [Pyrenophora tritici-repentis]KAI1683753.1 hypothetical protein KJE20_06258 [Pyrenophora tritici-repentis]
MAIMLCDQPSRTSIGHYAFLHPSQLSTLWLLVMRCGGPLDTNVARPQRFSIASHLLD